MLYITQCPICEGQTFTPHLTCIDHTVSHETFQLIKCSNCSFVITSPRPDNASLGKYYLSDAYISHSNKSSTPLDKAYQIARNFSLDWKIKLLRKHSSSTENNLLDYGCGTGEFLHRAKASGYHVRGVEPAEIARHQAQMLTGERIETSLRNVTGNADVITLWHVLEHVPDLNEIIVQLKSTLTKNGTIFIAVPNHRSHDGQRYKNYWAGYDVPRHLWHFSQSSMKGLLAKHQLSLKEIVPMKLDSFYVSMLSEKYKRKKNTITGLTTAFITGMNSNMKASSTQEYSSLIYIAKQ